MSPASLRNFDLLSDVDQIGVLDAVVLRELLIGRAILRGDAGERIAFFDRVDGLLRLHELVDNRLYRIVVIARGGQALLALLSVTPFASDHLDRQLRIGLFRGIDRVGAAHAGDNSRIILVCDVHIDIAGNAVYRALGRILPHAIIARIGRLGRPLREPDVVAALAVRVDAVGKPVLVRIHDDVVPCRLHRLAERADDVGDHGHAEVRLFGVLDIKGNRICKCFSLDPAEENLCLLLRLFGSCGVAVMVRAHGDARSRRALVVRLELLVLLVVVASVARAQHGELHARRFDLRPIDLALVLAYIDALILRHVLVLLRGRIRHCLRAVRHACGGGVGDDAEN